MMLELTITAAAGGPGSGRRAGRCHRPGHPMRLRPPRPRAIRADASLVESEREPTQRLAEVASGIPPGILRSQQAFWRDLPHLLSQPKLRGRWVCYHGDERIGIGTYDELIRECGRRGIPDDAFYLGRIHPQELPRGSPRTSSRSAATIWKTIPPNREDPRPPSLLLRCHVRPAPGGSVRVKPYQIVVEVSVSLQALRNGTRTCRAFPPSWTRGTTITFQSAEGTSCDGPASSLRHCGSLGPFGNGSSKSLCMPPRSGCTRIGRGNGPSREQEPHPLKLQQGIAVYPDDIGPRLPVLGLRALTQNQLHVAIDPERMRVNLRTPGWSTTILGWFGRLL